MKESFLEFSIRILPYLLKGMYWTLALTFVTAIFGTILGVLTALARISKSWIINAIASLYVNVFRGTPLLLQTLFVYGALPQMGLTLDPFPSVALAFSLNAGSYIAEIIRAGIQSIDRGQMEAARSLGMSYNLAMRRIILPQTYRRLIPPMVNELAAITKDTSLAMVVGIIELMKASQHQASSSFRVAETFLWTGLGYLILTVALTTLATNMEKKLEARG